MERLDFKFIKNRDIGELISDYISLFKQIFKHFNKSIFAFLLPMLAILLILIFLTSTLGLNLIYKDYKFSDIFVPLVFLAMGLSIFYFLFVSPFGFEYMFLLKEKGNTDFTGKDIWRRMRKNGKKYLYFLGGTFLIFLVFSIPIFIVSLVLAIIPLVGTLALGFLMACLTLIAITALFFYIEGKGESVFDNYQIAYSHLKKKIFSYGLASYLFQMMLSIASGILTILPAVIIGIIAYNTIGFNEKFFTTFTGKMLISMGGTILTALYTLGTVYRMSFYTIIYFSSLESAKQEGTLDLIDQIGKTEDENEEN